MSICCYPNCDTVLSNKSGINFFAFPLDDEENLRKWVQAIGKPDFQPTPRDLLCSRHFAPNCMANGILKPTSLPDRGLGISTKRETNSSDFDLCRICGSAKNSAMTDIFDDLNDICEKISICLPIVISITDNKPQGICDECLEDLECAARLVQKSIMTEAKLNKIFNQERTQKIKPLPLNGPTVCDICKVYFNDMALFEEHLVDHEDVSKPKLNVTGRRLTVCTDCGHLFSDWTLYDEHKAMGSSMCKFCSDKFETICNLNEHKCEKFKCKICGLMLKNDLQLQRHKIQAHKNKKGIRRTEKIDSDISSNNFDIPDIKPNINSHRGRMRNRKELYHCNICNIKYNSNKKLREHCIEYHGTPNVLWICKFCGKSMTTKVSLQIHERIHFDSKPYICEWCGNGYRSRANLNQHQVIHTGVRNHVCPKCGKRFSRKAFVRTHMRVHTGERPYICDICGQKFTQLGDMKRHRNRHQNPNVPAYPSDKVYACDFCGEQFTQLAMLKKHRLEHATQPITIIEENETKDLTINLDMDSKIK